MNDVKTFTAETMQDALQQVRDTLGPDAVIVHTRQVPIKSYLPWQKKKHETEITAMIDSSVPKRTKAPSVTPTAAISNQRKPSYTPSRNRIAANIPYDGVSLELSSAAKSASNSNHSPNLPQAEPRNLNTASTHIPENHPSASGVNRRVAAPMPAVNSTSTQVNQRLQKTPTTPSTNEVPDRFEERLGAIENLMEKLARQMHGREAESIPDALFPLFTKLIDAEVSDDISRHLLLQLKTHCTPDELGNESLMRSRLAGILRNRLRCSGPIQLEQGRQKIVALVGPTGVGKTTTIAKLAANFRLRDGIKMGLVTVDTYRIAAVEQLRTYAEIIDLPMKVVASPSELRRALDEFAGLDLVLIDTAGRSPKDDLKIQELKSLLGDAQIDEIHLVLSTIASAKTLEATAKKFSAVNLSSMILTKLDEVDGLGTVLSTQQAIGLPISYVTTGQDVPDDIEPAEAERLANLIIGKEELTVA